MLALTLVLATLLPGLPDDPTDLDSYERIVGEFDEARRVAIRASELAKTEAEERAIAWPLPKDFVSRLLSVAEAHPESESARKASLWIVEHNVDLGYQGANVPIVARAVDVLLRFHLDQESVGFALLELTNFPSTPRDRLLGEVLDRSKTRANRGRACFALAQYGKMKGGIAQQSRDPSSGTESRKWNRSVFGDAYAALIQETDPALLFVESERLYERVIAEFADLDHLPHSRFPGRVRTLGEIAKNDLDEIRNLSVGKLAPEIEGQGVDDRGMKLSDYRGKVVVLVFWGAWCPSCMAQVPHERELAKRMRGRPFALVGVNSDEDRSKVKATVEREGISWRSWFDDGRVGGRIARRWKVPYWPMVYVIDHRGIIQAKEVGGDGFMDRVVERLVVEAEKDSAAR